MICVDAAATALNGIFRRSALKREAVHDVAASPLHAVALFTTYYNFVRIHNTLRVTPAIAAGVSDRLWGVADIVALVEAAEAPAKKRGPYKSREHKSALL